MEDIIIKGWMRELTYAINIQQQIAELVYEEYGINHRRYILILEILYNPDITQYGLAKRLHFTKQHINKQCKMLLDELYIEEAIVEQGRRKKMFRVTPKGQELIEDINRSKNRIIEGLLDKDELLIAKEAFEKLKCFNDISREKAKSLALFTKKLK